MCISHLSLLAVFLISICLPQDEGGKEPNDLAASDEPFYVRVFFLVCHRRSRHRTAAPSKRDGERVLSREL
jgi:hypothetical protein